MHNKCMKKIIKYYFVPLTIFNFHSAIFALNWNTETRLKEALFGLFEISSLKARKVKEHIRSQSYKEIGEHTFFQDFKTWCINIICFLGNSNHMDKMGMSCKINK